MSPALTQQAKPDAELGEQEQQPDERDCRQQQRTGEQRAEQLVVVLEVHVVRGHDDELGRTQMGNNNAYCQDNGTSWLDWSAADRNFMEFVRRLLRLRSHFSVLRRARFFSGDHIDGMDSKDIVWLLPDGREFAESEWDGASRLGVCYALSGIETEERLLLLLVNASPLTVDFKLPPGSWRCLLNTVYDVTSEEEIAGGMFALESRSLVLFVGKGLN